MNRSGAVIKRPSRWSISLLVLQFLAVTGTLRGAAITWGPATDIAGDTDVVNTGVLVYSYEWDALPSTVNGVSFTALMGDPVNDVTQMNALQVRDSVPTWSAIRPAGAGTVRLIFNGPSADHYTLLTTTNIFTPISDWTPLPNGAGTFGAINITNLDSAATNKTQFYRIRSP